MAQTPIARSLKTMLVRIGDFSLNRMFAVPAEFQNLTPTNYLIGTSVPTAPVVPTPDFSHPDLGAVVAANFDDLVIDTQPVVRDDGSYSTNINVEPYRMIQEAGVPFWFVVRCDGYGRQQLQSRDAALNVAIGITASLWADANAYMLLNNLKGFAFLQADLNVVFPDGTVIDRLFQSRLVQAAHDNYRSAMMITARPNDHVTLLAPTIISDPSDLQNTNSGKRLAHPILGSSPQYRDRLVFLYPNPAVDYPNISLIVTQVQQMYAMRGRDPGFPLNIEFGCVLPVDATAWSPDGLIGLVANPPVDDRLAKLFRFLASLGISWVGIQSGPVGSTVPVPSLFMPEDGAVNVSGSSNVWSQDNEVFVSYLLPDGTRTKRAFDEFFNERLIS